MTTIFRELKASDSALTFSKTITGSISPLDFIKLDFEYQVGKILDYFESKHIYLQARHDVISGVRIGIAFLKVHDVYNIIATTPGKCNTVTNIELEIYRDLTILVFQYLDQPF